MKAIYETASAGAEGIPATKRGSHISTDGKWRSFPKVPNLLQYVIAGTYYARCKVDGKPVRSSLETDVFSVAKVRLPDKLKELRKPKAVVGTFTDGCVQFEQQTKCDREFCFIRVSRLARDVGKSIFTMPHLLSTTSASGVRTVLTQAASPKKVW